MTIATRASISSFPRGHEFEPRSFTLAREQVDAYLAAVGDTGAYGDSVPPLAAVALGLEAFQQLVMLPEGSLHTGQEVEHEALIRIGDPLTMIARVAQRSERQGYVISVVEFEIAMGSRVAVRARSTIMAPGIAS